MWIDASPDKLANPQFLELGAAVLFAIVSLRFSHIYWKRRLTNWAIARHLELVGFRGAMFYEGPSAWTRSRNQHAFRVVTRDAAGRERSCWMLFGTFWGFHLTEPLTQVIWDDDPHDDSGVLYA
jgi:hypothetical protein